MIDTIIAPRKLAVSLSPSFYIAFYCCWFTDMVDVVSQKTRSRMMSAIQGRHTRPELLIRQGLHRLGFRYALHSTALPGKPDLVFPKYRAVIQVNGCFWHAHGCHLFKWPSTRKEFWQKKISGNVSRDKLQQRQLHSLGWRVLTVWECALKGKARRPLPEVIHTVANWLQFDNNDADIQGKASGYVVEYE